MAVQNLVNQNINPSIVVKEISDQYIRKNFQNLSTYFATQNQLLNFKFFEVVFTKATASYNLNHGLGVIPQDVVMVNCVGSGQLNVNFGLSTSTQLNLSTSGAMRCRFFVGTYWNYVTTYQFAQTDTMVFNAVPLVINNITINETSSQSATAAAASVVTRNGTTVTITATSSLTSYTVNPATDQYIFVDTTGGAFTLNMPSKTSFVGYPITVERTNNDIINACTIKLNGADTFEDGTGTTTLNTFQDQLQMVSNGSGIFAKRSYNTQWVNSGVVTIKGTTTNPTPGTSVTNQLWWRRNAGKEVEISLLYNQTSGAGAIGSGDYYFNFPTNITLDTTIAPANATTPLTTALGSFTRGSSMVVEGAPAVGVGTVVPYDSGHFRIYISQTGGGGQGSVNSAFFPLNQNITYSALFTIPVTGWSSLGG